MAKKTTRTAAATAVPKAPAAPAPAPGDRLPVPSLPDRIKESFRDDTAVRGAMAEGLAERVRAAAKFVAQAEQRLDVGTFAPSLFTQREREPRRYLAKGEDVVSAQTDLVNEGVARIRDRSNPPTLSIEISDKFRNLVEPDANPGEIENISLEGLSKFLRDRLSVPLTLQDEPALTECAVEKALNARIAAIEGGDVADTRTLEDTSAPASEGGGGDSDPPRTKDFVEQRVHALLSGAPTPEQSPVLMPPDRKDLDTLQQSLATFELRSGPSDVTSYHDFNSLQIAFEHVWTEVFDQRVGQITQEILLHYLEVAKELGLSDDDVDKVLPKGFTSVDDITALMNSAKTLGQQANHATPPATPSAGTRGAWDIQTATMASRIFLLNPAAFGNSFDAAAGYSSAALSPFWKILTDALSTASGESALANALPTVTRLQLLLTRLEGILSKPYAFTVFKENTSNFGILVTYRQAWRPENYQVGELVSTIPLAPREVRRYTTRQVSKKSRAVKEITNNLNSSRTDIGDTARYDKEIVDRAENRTNFKMTADGSYGVGDFKIHGTTEAGGDSASLSATTKKNFREAVLKSAQEFKHDNRMEVESSTGEETENTTFHEIQNPNDELTVTYLFYELQRTYRISEKIHQVQPVVLVANRVPAPHEIDDAWLIQHDWILLRVLLDDSFRPALEYLRKSFVGDELNLQVLDNNVKAQRQIVDAIGAQVAAQASVVKAAERDLATKTDVKGGLEFAEGILGTVKRVFDPFQLTGQSVTGTKEGMDTVAEFAQQTLDRAEREKARLLDQLAAATSALQVAVDKLAAAIREHYDKLTEVDRLRVHVKQNILYYMQAIWNHEPPDQRYFRVFEVKVPMVQLRQPNQRVPLKQNANSVRNILTQRQVVGATMPLPDFEIKWKPLVEVADLDEVLGYKGNYAIYRLKENNHLTLHMMQDYLEFSDELKLRDPDDVANFSVDELQALATCLHKKHPEVYQRRKNEIRQLILDRLMSGRPEDDRVIVPTKSLYIEALVGTHPLMEDFKLLHRALDVKRAAGEVRRVELENVRLGARMMSGNFEDPDVDKKIVVQGVDASVTIQPETP
jgi:hypothetical protein